MGNSGSQKMHPKCIPKNAPQNNGSPKMHPKVCIPPRCIPNNASPKMHPPKMQPNTFFGDVVMLHFGLPLLAMHPGCILGGWGGRVGLGTHVPGSRRGSVEMYRTELITSSDHPGQIREKAFRDPVGAVFGRNLHCSFP